MNIITNEIRYKLRKDIINLILEYIPEKLYGKLPYLCGQYCYYNDDFIYIFRKAIEYNINTIYKYSWNDRLDFISYGGSGVHDINLAYALFHNDHLDIRKQLNPREWNILLNTYDKNGLMLKDSDYNNRDYSD